MKGPVDGDLDMEALLKEGQATRLLCQGGPGTWITTVILNKPEPISWIPGPNPRSKPSPRKAVESLALLASLRTWLTILLGDNKTKKPSFKKLAVPKPKVKAKAKSQKQNAKILKKQQPQPPSKDATAVADKQKQEDKEPLKKDWLA